MDTSRGRHPTTDLAEHGIHLAQPRPDWQGTACPECARGKRRPGDDALRVHARPDGSYYWQCMRCPFKGSIGTPERSARSSLWSRTAGRSRPHASRSSPVQPETTPKPSGSLDRALALYEAAAPIRAGTPVASYLQARGCLLPPEDGDLRFLHDHRHSNVWRGPCLVALVTDPITCRPMTVHRTWIRPNGTKAPVDRTRLWWRGPEKALPVVGEA